MNWGLAPINLAQAPARNGYASLKASSANAKVHTVKFLAVYELCQFYPFVSIYDPHPVVSAALLCVYRLESSL